MFQIHENSKKVIIGEWRSKALWVRLTDAETAALVELQPGLNARITKQYGKPEMVILETWAGEPETTDGVGVQGDGDLPSMWKRIPLCVCGERGCGNSGKQLKLEVDVDIAEQVLRSLTHARFMGVADQDESEWWLGYQYMFTKKLKPASHWTGSAPLEPYDEPS